LVVIENLGTTDLKAALPQSTALEPDSVAIIDRGDPTDEDSETTAGPERFVLAASYEAAAGQLRLELAPDAPELEVVYADHVLLGELHDGAWHAQFELTATRYVTVSAAGATGTVPFVVIDPHALTPRGAAHVIDLEEFFEILAGHRELPPRREPDHHGPSSPGANGRGDPIGARGAIPWRRYLAAVAGLGRELESERHLVRGLQFVISNPIRLAGLRSRLEDAHTEGRFTRADLAYALYELGREVDRVAALDAPEPSRKLLGDESRSIHARIAELVGKSDRQLRRQLAVLARMDRR
jgi:hypothetical protein